MSRPNPDTTPASPPPTHLSGSVRTELENAIVALFKRYYGQGPSAAKAWLLDDYVVVVMEEGLNRSEQTLVAAGREDVVRNYRLDFEQTVAEEAKSAVTAVLGRRAVSYHSQIVFHPVRTFELFVLEPRETMP